MNELEKCPDCGSPMEWEQRREIGREIRKEEFAMTYLHDPDGYRKLPSVVGRIIGEWHEEKWCSQCQYREKDGRVVRRGS